MPVLLNGDQDRGGVVPLWFGLLLGGVFGTSYAVKLQPNGIVYQAFRHSAPHPGAVHAPELLRLPAPASWQRFLAELDAVGAWSWRSRYSGAENVVGGYSFAFHLQLRNRLLVCSGHNSFPGERGEAISVKSRAPGDIFDQFCGAVSRLIGRPVR